MIGKRRVMQEALFYGFSLERHVPENHLLRRIDHFVDLSGVLAYLEPYYAPPTASCAKIVVVEDRDERRGVHGMG